MEEKKQVKMPPNQPAAGGNTKKDVLLLYKACDKKQRQVLQSFCDALVSTANGNIEICEKFDTTKNEAALTKDLQWLNQPNNVVLIHLSPDGIADTERIIRAKQFLIGRVLHDKVFAVSFGTNLPQGWLPDGVTRGKGDQRDFCLGLDESSLFPLSVEDFMRAPTMKSLVQAILATR